MLPQFEPKIDPALRSNSQGESMREEIGEDIVTDRNMVSPNTFRYFQDSNLDRLNLLSTRCKISSTRCAPEV